MTDIYMRILISAKDSAASVIQGLGSSLGGLGGGGLAAGAGLAVAGAAILAVGAGLAVSIKMAGDFQQGLNRLVTGAGDVTDNMAKMGQAILGISVDTGLMSGPLLQAMYLIISSGQRGAQALDTLAVAAKGAVIEQASVVDVANVLSGVMTNYGTSVFSATDFMNGLIRAVQLGKITLQDLAVAMGPIDPIAKSVGVSFSDLAAAMTTQTNAMVPAQRAATGLRFMMLALENPTKKAKDAMKAFGLDSVAVANEMKVSLPAALQMIYDAAKKAGPEGSVPFNRAVSDMVGGIRSFTAFTALTGPHMKDFAKNAAAIAAAMRTGSSQVAGWAIAQSNLNVVEERGKALFAAIAIIVGTALLPVVTSLISKVISLVAPLMTWLTAGNRLGTGMQQLAAWIRSETAPAIAMIATVMPVVIGAFMKFVGVLATIIKFIVDNQVAFTYFKILLIAIAAVIIGVLVAALLLMAISLAAVTIAIMVAAAPIIGIVLLIQHWGQITTWLGQVWAAFASWFMGLLKNIGTFFVGIWTAVLGFFVGLWTTVSSWFMGLLSNIGTFFVGIWNGMVSGVKTAWAAINAAVRAALAFLVNIFTAPFRFIGTLFTWLYNHNVWFQLLVDKIRSIVTGALAWLRTAWSVAIAVVVGTWQRMVATASALWTVLTSTIRTIIQTVVTWLQSAWNAAVSFIVGIWNRMVAQGRANWAALTAFIRTIIAGVLSWLSSVWTTAINNLHTNWLRLVGFAQDLWNKVTGVFKGAWNMLVKPLTDIAGNLIKWASGLADKALQWGKNLIQGLINGIEAMAGGVAQAVGDIAGKIGAFLGFHSSVFGVPKEGPAAHADLWMPALMKGLTGGIQAGIPQVQAALNMAIHPPSSGIYPIGVGGRTGSAAHGPVTMHNTVVINAQTLSQAEMDKAVTYLGDKIRAQFSNI